jgi:hypothetical protein
MHALQGPGITWCSPQTLKKPPGPRVALASFPGSGNTWVRYLLQQATGTYAVQSSDTCFSSLMILNTNTWLKNLTYTEERGLTSDTWLR